MRQGGLTPSANVPRSLEPIQAAAVQAEHLRVQSTPSDEDLRGCSAGLLQGCRPACLIDRPLGRASGRGCSGQFVASARVSAWLTARPVCRSLDNQHHRLRPGPAGLNLIVSADGPEEGTSLDSGCLLPGPQRPHRTALAVRGERYATPGPLPQGTVLDRRTAIRKRSLFSVTSPTSRTTSSGRRKPPAL